MIDESPRSSLETQVVAVGPSRRTILRAGLSTVGALLTGCALSPHQQPERPPSAPLRGVSKPEVDQGPPAPAASRPLLTRYSGLAAALPWIDLGGLPTRVTAAPQIARRLGLGELWIKRDDEAGTVYGGSKARKLEHPLAEARARSASRVLTFGGVGSNHALATAVHADRLGLGCLLLLLPEPPSEHARQHLLAEHNLGCEQLPARGTDERAVERALGRGHAAEERPYVIPLGGTSPLGNTGYVNGAFELAEQCAAGLLAEPEEIYVAAGTLGTAAGLYVGLQAAGLDTRLVAVRASNPGTGSLRNLRATIEATATFLRGLDPSFPEITLDADRLRLEPGFAGPGYAIPTAAGARAAAMAQELAGLELDQTYTAKAFAGLIARSPRLAGRRVLFWNTYDPRPVPSGTISPDDLPPAFRGYFPRRISSRRR